MPSAGAPKTLEMKSIVTLFYGILLLLVTGCASSSITVVDKKDPTLPYKKVLVVYVDEGCDFDLFDSTTYNICLKSCFLKTDNAELRGRVETLVMEDLATTGTAVFRSSDMLDNTTNSYDDFRKLVDNRGIDALLLVDFHMYSHTQHKQPPSPGHYINGQYYAGSNGFSYKTLNAAYECYFFNIKSISFPIWKAQIGIKGRMGAGKNGMSRSMAHLLANNLKANGYIAH